VVNRRRFAAPQNRSHWGDRKNEIVPFTPFHGGIGLALKGPLSRRFSFTIFTATQVAIDLESGYFLFTGQEPVHRFFHSFVGASIVCFAVAVLARPLCEAFLRRCARELGDEKPEWMDLHPKISRSSALLSAFLGMFGHVIPDSIMHADSRPFAPFSNENPFLDLVSLGYLHIGLTLLGAFGFGWMVLAARLR
jgi:hypothetical protein